MSKLNVNEIGITILSRAHGDISLIEKRIKVNGHYEDEYERRELIRNDLKRIGILEGEHLCFNCKNADPTKCPKVSDRVKQMLLDDDTYDFIEMGVQVYENKIKALLNVEEIDEQVYENEVKSIVNMGDLDEAVLFNVQKCKKYKGI